MGVQMKNHFLRKKFSRKAESAMSKMQLSRQTHHGGRNNALNRIRVQRLWRGISLEECARQLGFSVKEAKRQENPARNLRITQLRQWAIVLRVPVAYLIQPVQKRLTMDANKQDKSYVEMYNFFDDPATLDFLRERLCELVKLTRQSTARLENNLHTLSKQAFNCFNKRDQADLRSPRLKNKQEDAFSTADEDDELAIFNVPEDSINTVFFAFLREERSFKQASKILKLKSKDELKKRIHPRIDMTCSDLQWYSDYLNVPFSELVYDDVVPVNVLQDRAVIVQVLSIVNLIWRILETDIVWNRLSKFQAALHHQIQDCAKAFRMMVIQHEELFTGITAVSKTGRSHERKSVAKYPDVKRRKEK